MKTLDQRLSWTSLNKRPLREAHINKASLSIRSLTALSFYMGHGGPGGFYSSVHKIKRAFRFPLLWRGAGTKQRRLQVPLRPACPLKSTRQKETLWSHLTKTEDLTLKLTVHVWTFSCHGMLLLQPTKNSVSCGVWGWRRYFICILFGLWSQSSCINLFILIQSLLDPHVLIQTDKSMCLVLFKSSRVQIKRKTSVLFVYTYK